MPGEILVGLFDEHGHEPLDAGYSRVHAPLTNHVLHEERTKVGWFGIFDIVKHSARAQTKLPIVFGPFLGSFEPDKLGVWVGGMGPIFVDFPEWPVTVWPGNTVTIAAGWPIGLS